MTTSDARLAESSRSACLLPDSFRSPAPRALTGTTLALGLSTAMLLPLPASAADIEMATVRVEERAIDPNPYTEPGVAYKAKYSGDERHTRPLAETPQTITVLTQEAIQDTGKSDLRDILKAQPGITLGTGENGNAFGDRYIIRGQEARSDVFVDGLRDPGMTVRESFAVDQIEITKGPSSTFAGRGATGGAVNAVTKQATTDTNFSRLAGGVGTDSYHRLTADINRVLSDNLAVRVNLLDAYQEVPDRSPTDRRREGLAASLNWKPAKNFDAVLDYYHLNAKDRPDGGTYLFNGSPRENVPVYAQDQDFLKSKIDTWTLRLGWQFAPNVRITNLTRSGTTSNGYLLTSINGTTFGVNDPNAGKVTAALSSHQGWQDVDYFANQTSLYLNTELGGLKHEFIASVEYSDHQVVNGNYTHTVAGQNCKTGATALAAPNNAFCVYDGNGNLVGNLNNLMNRSLTGKGAVKSDFNLKTVSLAVMDTVDFNDKWTGFGGIRYDKFEYRNAIPGTPAYDWKLNDGLWNGHLGLTWKFRPDANIYATYSTASDFNGGESDVGGNCNYGGICVPTTGAGGIALTPDQRLAMFAASKPELSENLELGTKWNVNGGKLLLTGAAFQVTKKDVMENPGNAPYTDIGSMNTGKYRVRGLEFSVAGNVTDTLMVQGGYTTMEAKWLASANGANVGRGLSNFPEKSANLLVNWKATPRISMGGNLTYQASKYSGSPESVESLARKTPAYTTLDVFASYKFDKNLTGRLHINNVTNAKVYTAAYASGALVYLGDARNAQLSMNYNF